MCVTAFFGLRRIDMEGLEEDEGDDADDGSGGGDDEGADEEEEDAEEQEAAGEEGAAAEGTPDCPGFGDVEGILCVWLADVFCSPPVGPTVCLSVCRSVGMSVCLSFCLSGCSAVWRSSGCLPVILFVCASFCLPVFPRVSSCGTGPVAPRPGQALRVFACVTFVREVCRKQHRKETGIENIPREEEHGDLRERGYLIH